MKEIKTNPLPPAWAGKKVDCSACGRRYEMEASDNVRGRVIPTKNDTLYTISCPCCGQLIAFTV